MNEYIEVEYGQSHLADYMVEILTLGICRLFLEASFVKRDGLLTASYHKEGYSSLDALESLSAEDALSVVTALFLGAHQCEKHYVPASSFEVDPAHIYVNLDFSDTRMVFMPAEEERPMTEKAAGLLLYLAEKCSGEGADYIRRAADLVRDNKYGYKSVLHQLEKLRQEAYLCGIE